MRPTRNKTWGAVRNRPLVILSSHTFSQDSMNPYVNPTNFVRFPYGYSMVLCGCRKGPGTPYGQSRGTVRGPYNAYKNHKHGRHPGLARFPTDSKSFGNSCLKVLHARLSAMGDTPSYR